jgi:hypothetical protein
MGLRLIKPAEALLFSTGADIYGSMYFTHKARFSVKYHER